MSDYDIKNIPILDDIIESSNDDLAELKATDSDETGSDKTGNEASDDNFDLFVDDSTNDEVTSLIDTAEPEIGSIDEDIIDNTPAADYETSIEETQIDQIVFEESAVEQEPVIESALESALVDYQPGEDAGNNNETQLSDEHYTASLESIVDDVVKQLVPDLEQQLRFLVKQALEDKLPAEIIEQLSSKPD